MVFDVLREDPSLITWCLSTPYHRQANIKKEVYVFRRPAVRQCGDLS